MRSSRLPSRDGSWELWVAVRDRNKDHDSISCL